MSKPLAMDDKQLASYYDDQKAKGAGAHFAKAGLGFASPGMPQQGGGMRAAMNTNGASATPMSRPPLYADGTGAGPHGPSPPQKPPGQGYGGSGQPPPGPHPPFGVVPPQGMYPPQGMPQHMHRPPGFPPGMPQGYPGGPRPGMPGMPPMHMGPPPAFMGMPYGAPPPQYGMPPMGMHLPPGMPPPGMLAPPGALSGRGPPAHLQAQRPPGAPPGAQPGSSMSQPQHLPGPPHPMQRVGLPAPAAASPQPAASFQPAASPQQAAVAPPAPPAAEPQAAAPWHTPIELDPAASVRAAIAAESKVEEERAQKEKEKAAWIAHKTAEGQVYYYNTLTNESSWEKPGGFAGDDSKASAQLTPVSTQPVQGTEWSEVVCADGRKYYFKQGTQETSWSMPPDVKAILEKKPQLPASATNISPAAAAHLARSQDVHIQPGDEEDASFSFEDIQPRKARAPAPPKPPSIQKSVQELTQDFKDLLSEKGVTPFSRWEKELPKLITDARWSAIGSLKERRLIFDDFCKTSADEHKRGKAERVRRTREDFQALLNEAASGTEDDGKAAPGISADATLDALAEQWGSDPRWQACDAKLRAEMLEAKVAPLRLAKQQSEKDSEEKKKAQESAYRELLKEKKVAAGARWSKSKDSLADDKRYRALSRDQREHLFRKYVAEQEDAERAAAKERKDREEREREAHRKMARETEEAQKRRARAAATDAAANYRTLLSETVKDPDASWNEWRVRLAKDPQGRFTNEALDRRQAEAIFREHLASLQKRLINGYIALLEEVIRPLLPKHKPASVEVPDGPSALRRFLEAEKLLQDDPRFAKAPERERERLWRLFVEDVRLERDDPAAAARRGRVSLAGRTNKGRVQLKDDDGKVTDKAYEREYLAHDRKRIRRD